MSRQRKTNLLLGSLDRLRETEEGKSQVDEAVLVVLKFVLSVDDLCEESLKISSKLTAI